MVTDNIIKRKKNVFIENWDLFLFILPGVLYFIVFKYLPMIGIVIAFQNYRIGAGFFDSPWVGFEHFIALFKHRDFIMILSNTIIINSMKFVFGFPAPIIFALVLNEIRNSSFKRTVQTITYLPHFLSWVVIGGITVFVFSTNSGILNQLLIKMNLDTIPFLTSNQYFRWILIITDIWKEAGWGTIIYLAAISSIDPELYQAAKIDGVSRLQQIWYITIAGISQTIIILMILRVGTLIIGNFEQVYMLMSTPVRQSAEIISTYVFRVGVTELRYSFTTAVGLFQSLIAFILIFSTNKIAKLLGGDGIW
jgi:putative aldouronate transport system permease protein